jgi:aminopeptidase
MMFHTLVSRVTSRSSPALLRSMSSKAHIIPVDPKNPGLSAASNLNPAVLWATLPPTQKPAKVGTSHLFYGTGGNDVTALVSLGEGFETKQGDARREIIRKAVGSGVKSVKGLGDGVSEAILDASTDPHAAGEIKIVSVLLDLVVIAYSCRCSPGTV